MRDHGTADLSIQHAVKDQVIRVNCCSDDFIHAVMAGVRVTDRLMRVYGIGDGRFLDWLAGSQGLCSGEDGVLNGGIACTAAKRILQGKTNIILFCIRVALEQSMGCHNLPRDTESALHRAMFHKGFLQGVQFHLVVHALGESFDSDDHLSIGALGRIDARDNRLTVNEDCTRAALRFFTTDLCTRQTKALAKERGEGFARN